MVVTSATNKQFPATKPTERKHHVVEEAKVAQENEDEGHVMTRRQQKEAEIQRRERLVQEAMEMEEG